MLNGNIYIETILNKLTNRHTDVEGGGKTMSHRDEQLPDRTDRLTNVVTMSCFTEVSNHVAEQTDKCGDNAICLTDRTGRKKCRI